MILWMATQLLLNPRQNQGASIIDLLALLDAKKVSMQTLLLIPYTMCVRHSLRQHSSGGNSRAQHTMRCNARRRSWAAGLSAVPACATLQSMGLMGSGRRMHAHLHAAQRSAMARRRQSCWAVALGGGAHFAVYRACGA